MRCSRMSAGWVDAWTLPAPWKLRTPSFAHRSRRPRRSSPRRRRCRRRPGRRARSGTSLTMPGADRASQLAVCRPNATTTHGTGVTLQASQPATPSRDRQRRRAAQAHRLRQLDGAGARRATSAAAAASPISTRSAPCRADGGDQQQAEHQGAGDGADRVGRVDPSDQPPGVLAAGRRPPPAPAGSSLPTGTPAAGRPRGSAPGRAGRCTRGSATARGRSASRGATPR